MNTPNSAQVLKWYRCTTKVKGCSEPFVDWYQAKDEAGALEQARADSAEFCLPEDAAHEMREATANEAALLAEW